MSMVILKIYCIVLLLYFKAGKLGSDMNLLPRIILKRFLVVRASHSYKLHMSLPSLYGLLHTTITTIVITITIITITPISTLSPQPWPPRSSTFTTNAFISTLQLASSSFHRVHVLTCVLASNNANYTLGLFVPP